MLKKISTEKFSNVEDMILNIVSGFENSTYRIMPWDDQNLMILDVHYDIDDVKAIVLIECADENVSNKVWAVWRSLVSVNGRRVKHHLHSQSDDIYLS